MKPATKRSSQRRNEASEGINSATAIAQMRAALAAHDRRCHDLQSEFLGRQDRFNKQLLDEMQQIEE